MRRLAWLMVCTLVATVPAVGFGQKERIRPPGGPIGPGFPGQPDPALDAKYKAPKADTAGVVELFDEGLDTFGPILVNDGGGEAGTFTREDRDVFAGVEAARVTPQQKYRSRIPGWDYRIVEKPANANEFRYLRFAWKKLGGNGIVIQFHDPARTWAFRYHAGTNVFNWQPSMQVSEKLPTEWTVVTRDLFKDYGTFTISGVALSPLDGTSGLFDHMLLGRSIEDLDKATDAALGRGKAQVIPPKEREALWVDLMGDDRPRAATAQRMFLSRASEFVAFAEERLGKIDVDKDQIARIQKYLKDLDSDDFDARDTATDELVKLGALVHEAVTNLANSAGNDELRYRAKLVLKRMKAPGAPVSSAGRLARVVRLLERADTAEARTLLTKMEEGEYGFDIAADAKAALTRMKKK